MTGAVDLRVLFFRRAQEAFQAHPYLETRWDWDDKAGVVILRVPKLGADGFDVTVEIDPEEISIAALEAQDHFQAQDGVEAAVQGALDFLFRLLTSDVRIRERSRGGRPYCWDLEAWKGGRWQRLSHVVNVTSWLLGLPKSKEERVYQNRTLPGTVTGGQ